MPRTDRLTLTLATTDDAPELAALHCAVADHLTSTFGSGPWSGKTSEKGVRYAMRQSQVFIARQDGQIIATLRLQTKKPWAIDTKYFSKCEKPLYLLAMAVLPNQQRQGIGRRCLEEAERIARGFPAGAIRLDAYDASAGAGPFYARCGYRRVGRASYRGVPLIYYESLLG